MKCFYKNSLMIALICICVGIGMTVVGVVGGGLSVIKTVVTGNEILQDMSNKESAKYSYSMETYEIENLDLDIGASDLTIKYEDTDEYVVTMENGDEHICQVENGTLKFKNSESGRLFFGNSNRQKITIIIPRSAKLNMVDIELGAGKMVAEYLEAEELFIKVGAGDVQVERLASQKDAQLTVGAGNMDVKSLITQKNVELKVEAGNMDLDIIQAGKADVTCEAGRFHSGAVNTLSDVQISCGAGSVYMNMEQKEEEFNYDLKCSVGSISIGNEKFGGLDMEQRIEHSGDKELAVECNVGSVEIEFEG